MENLNLNTTSKRFQFVNDIPKEKDRIEAVRALCEQDNTAATCIQYAYHPDVAIDLPEGPLPANMWKPSRDFSGGAMKHALRRLKTLFKNNGSQLKPFKKEENFISMLESVDGDDALILLGIKEKLLPYENLTREFCIKAVPELFPTPTAASTTPAKPGTKET